MKLRVFCVIMLCAVVLVGCGVAPHRRYQPVSDPVYIAESESKDLSHENPMNDTTESPRLTYIYVDPETGVNYFVIDKTYSSAMCVRYNSDGTVYVSEGYGNSKE